MPPPTDVVFDAVAVYPQKATLRAALHSRDWSTCRAVLDAAAPMDRTALIGHVSQERGIEPFLRSVLTVDPADGTAAALLGTHLIDVGWEIRTGKRAKYVSREQFAQFREWLCRAEQVLIDGAMLNPGDPAIWKARLTSARGLSLGLAEVRRRYDRMQAADPGHLPGQFQMLQSYCPKWDGTWEQLHQFAREATEATPPGSPHAVLIVDAHIEHALDEGGLAEMVGYLSQPHVRADIYQAAQRSIGHPDFTRGYGWVGALSTFAMCFTILDDRNAAATAFRELGVLATEDPWHYLSANPAEEIRKARAWAFGGTR
ncbi:hypothetical protein [Actinoplanes utahensis]|uniref:DUF4034 domain-containing protein n=1 Tax=Actinoplanes utahensis TaxID=1869 RepID=A0A0A6UFM1_ACTUT|nr:hypothetical protein [Actinoplanes utahensis]KHD73868.1 hypothetical protein MB27_32115 [Actinoplanes utahensis]